MNLGQTIFDRHSSVNTILAFDDFDTSGAETMGSEGEDNVTGSEDEVEFQL